MNRFTPRQLKLAASLIARSPIPPDNWPYTDHFEHQYRTFLCEGNADFTRNRFFLCCLSVRKRGMAGSRNRTVPFKTVT